MFDKKMKQHKPRIVSPTGRPGTVPERSEQLLKKQTNPFLTKEQIETIQGIVGNSDIRIKLVREGHTGISRVTFNNQKYIIDKQGKILKIENPLTPATLKTGPKATMGTCPSCGTETTFNRWDIYVRCSKCGTPLRHVRVKKPY